MTAKQKKAELAEKRELLARHQRERMEQDDTFANLTCTLERQIGKDRQALEFKQIREGFLLLAKYGHDVGSSGQSIIDGTYNRKRR